MANQLRHAWSNRLDVARLPTTFIFMCVVVFIAAVSTTIYFNGSMADEMEMPGGWRMSMMWMRMPGQTWSLSTLSFLLMWLAMMVAMMMPSALFMFLRTRRRWLSLCYMTSGYFAIWLIAGFGIYVLGAKFNDATMRSEALSRAVPLLSGAALIAAGVVQFTQWKMKYLIRCRSPFGCNSPFPQGETSFRIGCRQGVDCCACCCGLMTAQLILGIMNPIVMVMVASVIAAEKHLPRPRFTAHLAGATAIVAGVATTIHWAIL